MELSKQVVSLELAKKLKELGVNKTGHFWWVLNGNAGDGWAILYECDVFTILNEKFQRIPAYTASELMEMMPCYLGQSTKQDGSGYLICYRVNDQIDEYECSYDGTDIPFTKANTFVDALALMFIHLIENDYDTKDFKP